MAKRLGKRERRAQVIDAAVQVAKEVGYMHMKRKDIADRAGLSTGTVSGCWGTMPQLRKRVMRHAITHEILEIVAQGLANRDCQATKAPTKIKDAALKSLR